MQQLQQESLRPPHVVTSFQRRRLWAVPTV